MKITIFDTNWFNWLVHSYIERGETCYFGERICVSGNVGVIISLVTLLLFFLLIYFLIGLIHRNLNERGTNNE